MREPKRENLPVRAKLFGHASTLSFEVFPPRGSEGGERLQRTLEELSGLGADFVSVTSSPKKRLDETVELSLGLARRGFQVVPHIVCRSQPPEEIEVHLGRLEEGGIGDILALRGDPPERGQEPIVGGLRHAVDLVRFVKRKGFAIGVGAACYPEGHVDCRTKSEDLSYLKEKVAAGAEYLITQAFFDNAFYFDFVERCRRGGTLLPILPGILPVTSLSQVEKLGRLWGATIPRRLLSELERCEGSPSREREAGLSHTVEQCRELLDRGAPGLHVFTMNRPGLAAELCARLFPARRRGRTVAR